MLVPQVHYFFSFLQITIGHFSVNSTDCTLVTANVGLVVRCVWNFCLNEGTIVLFDNIPDCVDLLNLLRLWVLTL